jgi:hypothetical protein
VKTSKPKDRWRMDTSALNQQYNEFRKAVAPRFNDNIPYDNRHTGATNQHKRAADFGLSGEAVALYDNHDYNTALTWYIAPLFEEVEIICRFGNELVEFCEQMLIYSLHQFLKKPWQVRHIAAAAAWWMLLGRTHLREQLKQYRNREFNLPVPNSSEHIFKQILGTVKTGKPVSTNFGKTLEAILGRNFQKNSIGSPHNTAQQTGGQNEHRTR